MTEPERRLTDHMLGLWNQYRDDGGALPADPTAFVRVEENLEAACYILRVEASPRRFIIDYIGAELVEGDPETWIGRDIRDLLPAESAETVRADFDMVIVGRVPLVEARSIQSRDGRRLHYREIVLPVSADGIQVTHLVGAARHREEAVPA